MTRRNAQFIGDKSANAMLTKNYRFHWQFNKSENS